MELHSPKKVKTTRFEMDQIKIEALEKENEKLKKDLQKANQKNGNLYRISVEYKKICEEEQHKSQILIQEISRLNQAILDQDGSLSRSESKCQKVQQKKLEKLAQQFKKFSDKISEHKALHQSFNENILSVRLNWSDLDSVIIKLLQFIADWIPLVHYTSHKKTLSYDEKASNPLFMKNAQKIIIKRSPTLSNITTEMEEKYRETGHSEAFEHLCSTTRSNRSSNTSFGNTRVKVYRREKSMSQLV